MFDSFPGPSERSIHLAKVEVKRVVKEEMIRLVRKQRLLTPSPFICYSVGRGGEVRELRDQDQPHTKGCFYVSRYVSSPNHPLLRNIQGMIELIQDKRELSFHFLQHLRMALLNLKICFKTAVVKNFHREQLLPRLAFHLELA